MSKIEHLYEDEFIKILYCEGKDDVCVFSFSGIGHNIAGMNEKEFVGTALRQKGTAVFIHDKKKSWYNNMHLQEVCDVVQTIHWVRRVSLWFDPVSFAYHKP